jgi:hypothetical protein
MGDSYSPAAVGRSSATTRASVISNEKLEGAPNYSAGSDPASGDTAYGQRPGARARRSGLILTRRPRRNSPHGIADDAVSILA